MFAGAGVRQGGNVVEGQPADPRQDLRRDLLFVVGDLEAIDDAIVVGVELVEEGLGVGLEFLQRDRAVVVGVGLGEPSVDRVADARTGVERLAAGADEDVQPGGPTLAVASLLPVRGAG